MSDDLQQIQNEQQAIAALTHYRTAWTAAKEKSALAKGHALQGPNGASDIKLPIEDHSDVKDAVATVHFVKGIPANSVQGTYPRPSETTGCNAPRTAIMGRHPPEAKPPSDVESNSARNKPRTRGRPNDLTFGAEFRSFRGIEVRSGTKSDTIIAEGCAVRYSPVVSQIRDESGTFGEEVMPGAATNALNRRDADVKWVINHGAGGSLPLARYCPSKGIDTLKLDERNDGLHFRAEMSAVTAIG